MIYRKGLVIFAFSLLSDMALSQSALIPSLDTLALNFIESIKKKDKEKVFVHTDRGIYAAGDDIWLKVYCIGEISHKSMKQSKSLFVDVVSDADSLVSRIMLNNGLGKLDGHIRLPAVLPEGYYWLRAYTRIQVESDPLSVYVQPLYVFNPSIQKKLTIPNEIEDSITKCLDTGRLVIKFYPEGGHIIAGGNTTFAFTAFDQQGRPMEPFGYITDSSNLVVAKFGTSMPGFGSFSFFAAGSMKYMTHTIYGPGKQVVTILPEADVYGYQLSVTGQSDDSLFVLVNLGDSVYKKFRSSFVIGVSRDSLCFAASGKDMYVFSIAKKSFPAGKASLLLFNEEEKIVSQRDIYINKTNSTVSISTDHKTYGPRQKVSLTILTRNAVYQYAPTILSIAVIKENEGISATVATSISHINQDDITFPCKDQTDSVINKYSQSQWDLIMRCQPSTYLGWDMNKESNFINLKSEQSDSDVTNLTGRVLGRKNIPVKNKVIILVSNNGENILEIDTTNENGRFHFSLPEDVTDSTRLNFQVSNTGGVPLDDSIEMDSMKFPRLSTPVALKIKFSRLQTKQPEGFKLYQLDSLAVGRRKKWLTLTPVTVNKAKKTPVTYNESKIVSPFSRIIPGDKIGLNPNSIEIALLSVGGVSYRNGGIIIHGGGIGGRGPLLFADGSQVSLKGIGLFGYLSSLIPGTIDFIEVLEGADATIYGPGSDGGVIYLHMLHGFRPDPKVAKIGLKIFYSRGYFSAPLFQEPAYDKKEIRNSPYPDQRSTIYWNGNIITDVKGKATLQFYTADNPINYSVFVMGLTSGGEILLTNGKISGE